MVVLNMVGLIWDFFEKSPIFLTAILIPTIIIATAFFGHGRDLFQRIFHSFFGYILYSYCFISLKFLN